MSGEANFKRIFMKNCTTCNGHKTVTGMGHMKEKCPLCKGTGLYDTSKQVDPPANKRTSTRKKKKE